MPYANNKGADQPVRPRCLITPLFSLPRYYNSSSFYVQNFETLASFCAAQAGLSLTWSQTPKRGFAMSRLIKKMRKIMK